MANTFLDLPAPAGNGAGAAVDVSSMGALHTVVAQGVWPINQRPTITIEINNAAVSTDGSWAPICPSLNGSGVRVFQCAAKWMRQRVSGLRPGGAPPSVKVGANDNGATFASLPVPAGNGTGAAVDVHTLPQLLTLVIGGRFVGSIILEISEDAAGVKWSEWQAMQAPGALTQIATAYWARIKRVGVPTIDPYGAPIANLGATDPVGGSGGGSSGIDVQDESVPLANNPHTTLNFIGAGVTATDVGGGVAQIAIPGGGSSGIAVENQGAPVANNPHTTLNFTGPGVVATDAGAGVAADTIGSVESLAYDAIDPVVLDPAKSVSLVSGPLAGSCVVTLADSAVDGFEKTILLGPISDPVAEVDLVINGVFWQLIVADTVRVPEPVHGSMVLVWSNTLGDWVLKSATSNVIRSGTPGTVAYGTQVQTDPVTIAGDGTPPSPLRIAWTLLTVIAHTVTPSVDIDPNDTAMVFVLQPSVDGESGVNTFTLLDYTVHDTFAVDISVSTNNVGTAPTVHLVINNLNGFGGSATMSVAVGTKAGARLAWSDGVWNLVAWSGFSDPV